MEQRLKSLSDRVNSSMVIIKFLLEMSIGEWYSRYEEKRYAVREVINVGMVLHGRMMITTDETEVTMSNILTILLKALPYHWKNRSEIEYLYGYYKGIQPMANHDG